MESIYLSGPMTGLPDLNYPAFRDAAAALRGRPGVTEVYNPADWETVNNGGVFDLHKAFEDYCRYIIWTATCLVVLPGWEHSPGATAEVSLAKAIKKPVYKLSYVLDDHPTLFTTPEKDLI